MKMRKKMKKGDNEIIKKRKRGKSRQKNEKEKITKWKNNEMENQKYQYLKNRHFN